MIIIYNSHLILGLFVQVCTWRAQWRGPHLLQVLLCETIGQAFYWVKLVVVSSYPRSFHASSHLKSPMKRPVPLAKPPMWDNWTSILLGQVRDGDGGGGGRGWLQFITLLSYPRFFLCKFALEEPIEKARTTYKASHVRQLDKHSIGSSPLNFLIYIRKSV